MARRKKWISQVDRETIKSDLSSKTVEGLMETVDAWVSEFNISEMKKFVKSVEDFRAKAMRPVEKYEAGVTVQDMAHEVMPLFTTGYYLIEKLRNSYVTKNEQITVTFASKQTVGSTGERLVIRENVPIKEVLTSIGVYMGGKRNELRELTEVTSITSRFTKRPNLKGGKYQTAELTRLFDNIITVSKRKGNSRLNGGWAFEVYQQILSNDSLKSLATEPNAILDKSDHRYNAVIQIINNARQNVLPFFKGPDDQSSMSQLKMWNFSAPSLANLHTIYRCLKVYIALFNIAKKYAQKTGKNIEADIVQSLFTTKTIDQAVDGVDDILAELIDEEFNELNFNNLEKIITIK